MEFSMELLGQSDVIKGTKSPSLCGLGNRRRIRSRYAKAASVVVTGGTRFGMTRTRQKAAAAWGLGNMETSAKISEHYFYRFHRGLSKQLT